MVAHQYIATHAFFCPPFSPAACGIYEALFSRARPITMFADQEPVVDVETLALSKTKQAEAALEEKARAKAEEQARQAVRLEREKRDQQRQHQQGHGEKAQPSGDDEGDKGEGSQAVPAAEDKSESTSPPSSMAQPGAAVQPEATLQSSEAGGAEETAMDTAEES